MGKFLRGPEAADQVQHTAVQILRQIAVLQEQRSGAVIRQIIFQRVGAVDVDQGAAPENPERQDADPFGNQLPV